MKATVEYNLQDEKEHELFLMSLRAHVMQSKIDDVYAILRKYRKYEELNDEQRKFF